MSPVCLFLRSLGQVTHWKSPSAPVSFLWRRIHYIIILYYNLSNYEVNKQDFLRIRGGLVLGDIE